MRHSLSRVYPLTAAIATRIQRHRQAGFPGIAEEVAPAVQSYHPPVFFDEADWDIVTALEPSTNIQLERDRIGGRMCLHSATVRYRMDNVLATPQGVFTFQRSFGRCGKLALADLATRRIPEFEAGFSAANSVTLRYFGHFLNDGLPAALLRQPGEELVLPFDPAWQHAHDYLRLLDLHPCPELYGFYRKLWICDDRGVNAHRQARTRAISRQIQAGRAPSPHAGVFLRRGASGVARVLGNEDELADRLAGLGFAICDIDMPLERMLDLMAEVGTVVTMEGSQWVHAHFGAAADALIVTINPADRFNNIAADMVPALGQRLATIVAPRDGGGYRVDIDRLLALIDRARNEMARQPQP